jgi:DNA helicase-2/ATP-dependent DNA helicase PcrA
MFTDEQKKVIFNNSDNILLLACAGSGKTFTVANKIAEEIKSGVSPEEILCLTFTVKGAEELKDAVQKYCGASGVNVFTIHSFCYYVIKEYYRIAERLKNRTLRTKLTLAKFCIKCLLTFLATANTN